MKCGKGPRRVRLARPLDFQALGAAVVGLFLVLGDIPWWTVTGTGSGRLLTVSVSPFYSQLNLLGLSSDPSFPLLLGWFTRLFLVLGVIGLVAVAIRPLAWWRSLVGLFSLVSLAELYLSFLLMQLRAVSQILAAYGVAPPFYGTGRISADVIGLDLNLYRNPVIKTEYGLPFYLGLATLVLAAASFSLRSLRAESLERKGVQAIFTADRPKE